MQWSAGVVVLAVMASVSSLSYYSVLLEEWQVFKVRQGGATQELGQSVMSKI